MAATYDYVTFTLERARPIWTTFSANMRDGIRRAISDAGGELLGHFAPQLGFASNEATALVRWRAGRKPLPRELTHAQGVKDARVLALSPTARPNDDQPFRAGGIYVHRWFMIDGDSVDTFVDLSTRAWVGFEGSYDTEIFGLFVVDEPKGDVAELLLLTWYKDHGAWEASREQAQNAQSLFAQRHKLTRMTIGRSSILVA